MTPTIQPSASRRVVLALLAATGAGAASAWIPQVATHSLPFRRDGGFILITVQLAGQPATAIVDNGAAFSVIDAKVAQTLGQAMRGRRRLNGANVPTTAPLTVVVAGEAVTLSPSLADLGVISGVIGQPVAMILGYDVLAGRVAALDFDHDILTLTASEHFSPPPGATALPVTRLADRKFTTNVTVDDGPPVPAMVDLGFAGEAAVSAAFAARTGLAQQKPRSTSASSMFVGETPRTLVAGLITAKRLTLGRASLPNVPLQILSADEPGFSAYDAVIGAPILTRFNLWLDLATPRLWVQPNSHLSDPFPRDRIGLQGYMDGPQFRIMHVRRDSPAAQAGLTLSDRIATINGQPAADMIEAVKYAAPLGQTYVLGLADGRRLTVVATDYY